MTINPNESLEIILRTFPEYEHDWIAHLADWTLDDDDRPFGLDIANFSTFACEIIKGGSDIVLKRIIDVTEEMFTKGDEKVKMAFKYQFLENITNRMNDIPIERFTSRLKEHSKRVCIELDILWGTQTPGLM